jgi:hypothetical protein
MVATDPVLVVPVVHVWQALETLPQTRPYRLAAHEPGSPGLAAPWHVQHAVVREERHDAVEIVGIERLEQIFKPVRIGHGADPARSRGATRPVAAVLRAAG